MYKFLKDWPKDREMGWSSELSGVCHDEGNWFFTQNGNLWKFPLSHNLNDSCKSENLSKDIRKREVGFKLGDCDCCDGYLFVPVVGDGKPYIQVFRTSDLKPVCKQVLTRYDKYYTKINWCAIDPRNNRLYTSDNHLGARFSTDWSPLMVYRINFSKIYAGSTEFLYQEKYYDIYNEDAFALTREHTRGGCFDPSGRIYISNGLYTLKGGDHNFANDKGGISVFEISQEDIASSDRGALCRIAKSSQSKDFKFQFDGTGQEPRGLTYWDLDGMKKPGDLDGQLHVIMIDNSGVGADDFYFKHFKRITDYQYTVTKPRHSKRGLIIISSADQLLVDFENETRRENRDLATELFRKRGIDYTLVVDPICVRVDDIISNVFAEKSDWVYTYINCHGYDGGMAIGSDRDTPIMIYPPDCQMDYTELGRIYENIPGKKVFLIESCHSGSADVMQTKDTYILCSATADKNSRGDIVYGGEATRYWCAGAGNDFILGADDDLEADKNRDNKVTLNELLTYTNQKLKKRLLPTRCVAYPASCNEVIFE